MLVDNYIIFVFTADVLMIIFRKTLSNHLLRPLKYPTLALLGIFCAFNLNRILASQNHFKFLELPRNFTPEEFNISIKNNLAKYDPDKLNGETDNFIKTNELNEIYKDPKGEYWFNLHSVFNVDPITIFYDKFSHRNFETYQTQGLHSFSFSAMAVLMVHLLLFEDVSSSNILLGISGICLLAGFVFEATMFQHPSFHPIYFDLKDLLDSISFFNQNTYFETVAFIKVGIASLGFSITAILLLIKDRKKKQTFEQIWQKLEQKTKENAKELGDLSTDIEKFARKLEKRIKHREKEMKTVFWSILLPPVAFLINYLDALPQIIAFVQENFFTRSE